MAPEDLQALLCLLEALSEVERQAGCSDRFFRQLYTARIAALRASGLTERLAAAVAAGSRDGKGERI